MMSQSEWATLVSALPNLEAALESGDTSYCVNMSELRRATISDFKKSALSVDIREWYKDDSGTLKPGQKGVSLSSDAFQVRWHLGGLRVNLKFLASSVWHAASRLTLVPLVTDSLPCAIARTTCVMLLHCSGLVCREAVYCGCICAPLLVLPPLGS